MGLIKHDQIQDNGTTLMVERKSVPLFLRKVPPARPSLPDAAPAVKAPEDIPKAKSEAQKITRLWVKLKRSGKNRAAAAGKRGGRKRPRILKKR